MPTIHVGRHKRLVFLLVRWLYPPYMTWGDLPLSVGRMTYAAPMAHVGQMSETAAFPPVARLQLRGCPPEEWAPRHFE